MDKIKEFLSKLTSRQFVYIGIMCLWSGIGIATLAATTEISKVSYFCTVLVILLVCLDNVYDR